jgi:hypothetical protein
MISSSLLIISRFDLIIRHLYCLKRTHNSAYAAALAVVVIEIRAFAAVVNGN